MSFQRAKFVPSERPGRGLFVRVTAAVVCADLGSKAVASASGFPSTGSNRDLSLGLVRGSPGLLAALMAIGLLFIGGVSWLGVDRAKVAPWTLGLVMGGAVSNFMDRLIHGLVHDFIPLGPVLFNVADVAVLLGLVAAAVSWRNAGKPRRGNSTENQSNEGGE
jgi:lipoprotein signal peptidase